MRWKSPAALSVQAALDCLLKFSALEPTFTVYLVSLPSSSLPTASTCFNMLKLPEYPTEAILRRMSTRPSFTARRASASRKGMTNKCISDGCCLFVYNRTVRLYICLVQSEFRGAAIKRQVMLFPESNRLLRGDNIQTCLVQVTAVLCFGLCSLASSPHCC